MIKRVFIATLLLFSSGAFSQEFLSSYGEAQKLAKEQGKNLFLVFTEPSAVEKPFSFEVVDKNNTHVFLSLSNEAKLRDEDEHTLRQSRAFTDLSTMNGIVILDYTKDSPQPGRVISVLPEGKLSQKNVQSLIYLPKGTLTQRTMVWAVRNHHANPSSANSIADSSLLDYSRRYADKMVSLSQSNRKPGWNGGMWSVPAMNHGILNMLSSGGNEEILNSTYPISHDSRLRDITYAAEDMVSTWHDAYNGNWRTMGHWRACYLPSSAYAYDMKYDARNGLWYSIGIFRR